MGQVSHFLGIKFDWWYAEDNNIYVYLSQEYYAEQLITSTDLSDATAVRTTFWSNHTIDTIPSTHALPTSKLNYKI